jgi:DNA-binding transcriptional MerR regulator
MSATAPVRERLLTIGTVCRRLQPEFPDISISKIRYLEDQGLLTPKRTQGGYRLFTEDDVDRLETILRLQRDEFLPLRVIREELASGASKARRKRSGALADREAGLDLDGLCERAGIDPRRARELEEFGLLEPRVEGGQRIYSEHDAAAPARVPHRRRPRDRPARRRDRAGAPLAQSGAAPRRGGGPPGDGRGRERAVPASLLAQRP